MGSTQDVFSESGFGSYPSSLSFPSPSSFLPILRRIVFSVMRPPHPPLIVPRLLFFLFVSPLPFAMSEVTCSAPCTMSPTGDDITMCSAIIDVPCLSCGRSTFPRCQSDEGFTESFLFKIRNPAATCAPPLLTHSTRPATPTAGSRVAAPAPSLSASDVLYELAGHSSWVILYAPCPFMGLMSCN